MKKVTTSIFGFSLLGALTLDADGPQWWTDREVIDESVSVVDNYALANIGQGKWIALQALEELESIFPSVGSRVRLQLVGPGLIFEDTFPVTDEEKEAQLTALNLGQVKSMAYPFYLELEKVAPGWLEDIQNENGNNVSGSVYPWDPSTPSTVNLQVANLGQLKSVFALWFELDQDGTTGPDVVAEAFSDPDGDGASNLAEADHGTDRDVADSDGDGLSDGLEIALGSDPNGTDTVLSSSFSAQVLTPLFD